MTAPSRARRRARGSVAALLGAALLAAAAPAWAGPDDPAQAAGALYQEGRRLMAEAVKSGDAATLAEGCKKLEASLALIVRGHTLFNLALCHERQGKTASAFREYKQGVDESHKMGRSDGVAAAKQALGRLEPQLSTFTLEVPAEVAKLEGFTLEVNGEPWPEEKRNQALTLDPGAFEVKATAKGYKPFAAKVELGGDKDRKTVTVALELEPPPPPPPKPEPPPPPKPPPPPPPPKLVAKPRPVWPWIVGGAGVGLVGASIGFVVDQRSAASQLDGACGPKRACPFGYDYHPLRSREVRDHALFLGLGAGGVVALGGAAVGLALGSRRQAPVTATLLASPTSIGLEVAF